MTSLQRIPLPRMRRIVCLTVLALAYYCYASELASEQDKEVSTTISANTQILARARTFRAEHPISTVSQQACEKSLEKWVQDFERLLEDTHAHGRLKYFMEAWGIAGELDNAN